MDERVPSWQVTAAMLNVWGFPVQMRDKCVGMSFVQSKGMRFHEAVHAAWAAGFVRMAAIPESVADARHAASRALLEEEHRTAVANVKMLKECGSL